MNGITDFRVSRIGLLSLLITAQLVTAQTADEILGATGITSGLGIHLGCGDGSVTVGLDNGGKILVHGLAVDQSSVDKARAAAMAAGKYGLVSIEKATLWAPLPYASNLANLVVADLDLLGPKGLTEQEILRVVVPNGAAYVKKGGTWQKSIKPRPAQMGDWTHWQYDATSNEVSPDALAAPPTQLQWMSGYRATTGSPGGGGAKTTVPKLNNIGVRSADGKLVYGTSEIRGKQHWRQLRSVDGFNGIPSWNMTYADDRVPAHVVIATPERVYTVLGTRYKPAELGYLVGVNSKTGEVEKTYDQGISFTAISKATLSRSVVHSDGTLLQADSNLVVALDASTGVARWRKTLPTFAHLPVIAPDLKLAFVVAASDRRIADGRNPKVGGVKQVIGYDLATGAEKWRWNFPSSFSPVITQMVYKDNAIVLFGADDAVMHHLPDNASRTPILARINATTGAQVFAGTYNAPSQGATYNGLKRPGGSTSCETVYMRDGKIFESLNWRYHTYDIATGKESGMTEAGWQRSHTWPGYGCEYQRATVNYHIISGGYVDKHEMVNRQFITRASCATGFFPANGLIYTNDGGCNCWGQLRGEVAMASDAVLDPIEDSGRLDNSPGASAAGAAPPQAWPSGLLAESWHSNQYEKEFGQIVDTIVVGGVTYFNDIHRHTLTAMKGASPAWHFTAGGRISRQLASSGGNLYVGGHDGWVYCLNESDGSLKWRFLAAPNDQKMVVCSQVESRWPVMGVAIYEGKLAVTAGWHPEVSGGVYAWGLDPAKGSVAWKVRIHSPRTFVPPSVAKSAHSNKMLGGEFLTENGQLVINGTSYNTNRDKSQRFYQFVVTPEAWNGKTIDPKTDAVVSVFNPSKSFGGEPSAFVPVISMQGSTLIVNFGTAGAGNVQLRLLDMAGKTVWAKKGSHKGTVAVTVPRLAKGTYTASVVTAGRFTTKTVVLR